MQCHTVPLRSCLNLAWPSDEILAAGPCLGSLIRAQNSHLKSKNSKITHSHSLPHVTRIHVAEGRLRRDPPPRPSPLELSALEKLRSSPRVCGTIDRRLRADMLPDSHRLGWLQLHQLLQPFHLPSRQQATPRPVLRNIVAAEEGGAGPKPGVRCSTPFLHWLFCLKLFHPHPNAHISPRPLHYSNIASFQSDPSSPAAPGHHSGCQARGAGPGAT